MHPNARRKTEGFLRYHHIPCHYFLPPGQYPSIIMKDINRPNLQVLKAMPLVQPGRYVQSVSQSVSQYTDGNRKRTDWSQFLLLYVEEIYCLNYRNGWNDWILNKYISFEARNNQLMKGREMSSGVDKNRVVYFLLNSLPTPPLFLFLIPYKMCFLKRVVEQRCMAETRTLNYSSPNYSRSSDWCFSLPHLRQVPAATGHTVLVSVRLKMLY